MAHIPSSSLQGPSFASLAGDSRGTDSLRGLAARDPKSAIQETARQFEALFTQELLKSMRKATPSSDFLDNDGSRMGTELLDAQLSTQLTGLPGGLADSIARQLERQMGLATVPTAASSPAAPLARAAATAGGSVAGTPAPAAPGGAPAASSARAALPRIAHGGGNAQSFIARHEEAAREVQAQTGIPAAFMLAQAALETGWGRKDIRMADGSPSNNLFGIKATPGWTGPVAEVTTTEYVNGKAVKGKARFRAYANSQEAFADYARLMKNSPRYERVLAQADTAQGFAQGLQKAGYATDPQYAEKLGRVINTTLRLQRAMG